MECSYSTVLLDPALTQRLTLAAFSKILLEDSSEFHDLNKYITEQLRNKTVSRDYCIGIDVGSVCHIFSYIVSRY